MFGKFTIRFGRFADITAKMLDGAAQVFYLNAQAAAPSPLVADLFRQPGVTAFNVPCKVLEPEGRDGSFAPMDDQARVIADFIGGELRSGIPIFIVCDHGELRSPAFALGLSELADGPITSLTGEEIPRLGTFGGRSAGVFADRLYEVLDKRSLGWEFECLGGILKPTVIHTPLAKPDDIKFMVAKVKELEWDLLEADTGGYVVQTPIGRIQVSAIWGTTNVVELRIQAHHTYPTNLLMEAVDKLFPVFKISGEQSED